MKKELSRDLILWVSVLAGPIFWLCSFQAKFAWVPVACAAQTKFVLLLFSLGALTLTAVAGFMARRQWKELRKQPSDAAGSLARGRFMALGGMVFSLGFCMVILAQTIPDLILGVCQ